MKFATLLTPSSEYMSETPEFSDHCIKILICYKQKGYNIAVIKQSACLADNPITADHLAL